MKTLEIETGTGKAHIRRTINSNSLIAFRSSPAISYRKFLCRWGDAFNRSCTYLPLSEYLETQFLKRIAEIAEILISATVDI